MTIHYGGRLVRLNHSVVGPEVDVDPPTHVPSDELVDEIGRTLFEYLVPALGLEDKIHVKDMWRKAARDALAVIREEVHGRGISDHS